MVKKVEVKNQFFDKNRAMGIQTNDKGMEG